MGAGNNGISQNNENNNSNSSKFSRSLKREGKKSNALHQEPEELKKYGVGQALLDRNILKLSHAPNRQLNGQNMKNDADAANRQLSDQEWKKGHDIIHKVSIIYKIYGDIMDEYMEDRGVNLEN